MAFLFVDSLAQNNSRFVQISGKILELLLLSVGLISTLVVMKDSVLPYSCDLVFSSLLGFWSSIRCFLSSPPTVVIITINVTVLLIAASTLYGRRQSDNHHHEITTLLDLDNDDHEPPPSSRTRLFLNHDVPTQDLAILPLIPHETAPKWKDIFIEDGERETDGVPSMEATWESIAKQKPKKKRETWDHVPPPRVVRRLDSEDVVPTSPKWKDLRKAETFNDAVSATRRGGMIRRDPSMSLEEFNQKVDDFIKKINNNMRLQRQESRRRFLNQNRL